MSKIVYTMGYSGKTPEAIARTTRGLDAIVFDVRYSPRSRNPNFSRKRFSERLAERYQHVRAFGNRNYRGGPIVIDDYEAGKALIEKSDRPVILMCVCRDPQRCHRTTIARRLVNDGFTVTELDQGPSHRFVQPMLPIRKE